MFKFENKKLSYNNTVINSSISILDLVVDKDASVLGLLKLSNQSTLTINFVKVADNKYKGVLKLSKEHLPYLNKTTFRIVLTNSDYQEKSNIVELKFDLSKIKLAIASSISNELEELYTKINKLTDQLNYYIQGNILNNVTIKNQNYIKKGMVLTALDDKGNFVAEYPFNNLVSEINGQTAINGLVTLDASMIQYNSDKTVHSIISTLIATVEALNEFIKTLASNLSAVQHSLDILNIRFEQHLNDGVI